MHKFLIASAFLCSVALAESADNNLFYSTGNSIKIKLEITQADIRTYNETVKLLNAKNYVDALSWADSIESEYLKEAMTTYAQWQKYRAVSVLDAEEHFSSLLHFIQTHLYLPSINELKEKAEKMFVNGNIPYQYAEDYFKNVKPLKTETVLKILENNQKDIAKKFQDYDWQGEDLSVFLKKYGKMLDEDDYAKKVESLLWADKYSDAKILLPLLSDTDKKLYEAIITGRYNDAPNHRGDNELLLWKKFMSFHMKKMTQPATNILLGLPRKVAYPESWWTYRKSYSRDLINVQKYKEAYSLAAGHDLKKGSSSYAEAEWLAGWIALEFLKKPKVAYTHFHDLYDNVRFSSSKSRAAYWIGRAMVETNDKTDAVKWFSIGAAYPMHYYGQLSLHARNEMLGIPSLADKTPLPTHPPYTSEEEDSIINNEIVELAYLMVNTGGSREHYTELFRNAIDSVKTDGERSAIFEVVKNTKDEQLITNIAKFLSYRGVYFVENLYPVLTMINLDNPNAYLIHAIIKQESGFHVSAKSRAGATGFMQLMPATAKMVARSLKMRYNERLLRTDAKYNITLGSYYINSLIRQFDGSQVLAIAAYNAGPSPVKRWIDKYGDPRLTTDIKKIINWIESIDYGETRNYVQRIIENSIVYEYILGAQSNISNPSPSATPTSSL